MPIVRRGLLVCSESGGGEDGVVLGADPGAGAAAAAVGAGSSFAIVTVVVFPSPATSTVLSDVFEPGAEVITRCLPASTGTAIPHCASWRTTPSRFTSRPGTFTSGGTTTVRR